MEGVVVLGVAAGVVAEGEFELGIGERGIDILEEEGVGRMRIRNKVFSEGRMISSEGAGTY